MVHQGCFLQTCWKMNLPWNFLNPKPKRNVWQHRSNLLAQDHHFAFVLIVPFFSLPQHGLFQYSISPTEIRTRSIWLCLWCSQHTWTILGQRQHHQWHSMENVDECFHTCRPYRDCGQHQELYRSNTTEGTRCSMWFRQQQCDVLRWPNSNKCTDRCHVWVGDRIFW